MKSNQMGVRSPTAWLHPIWQGLGQWNHVYDFHRHFYKKQRNAFKKSKKPQKNNLNAFDIVEANIKVRLNYTGFIPATINIIDKEGNTFLVQTVIPVKGRWLIERNPHIDGTFSRQAAISFDEFNLKAEQHSFIENIVVSHPPPQKKNKKNWNKTARIWMSTWFYF